MGKGVGGGVGGYSVILVIEARLVQKMNERKLKLMKAPSGKWFKFHWWKRGTFGKTKSWTGTGWLAEKRKREEFFQKQTISQLKYHKIIIFYISAYFIKKIWSRNIFKITANVRASFISPMKKKKIGQQPNEKRRGQQFPKVLQKKNI